MHIALISFEYPIDTNWGGIATYVQQAAYMLHNGGYEIEVFCGTNKESYSCKDNGVSIHLCNYTKRMEFYKNVVEQFKQIHEINPFDVIEVPEFATDAKKITDLFPEIAVVIKTHSPDFYNHKLNFSGWGFYKKLVFIYTSLRSLKIPNLPMLYRFRLDSEYIEICKADVIVSPSKSLREYLIEKWKLKNVVFEVLPNVFKAFHEYMSVKNNDQNKISSITYIGRLEIRKGILTLAKAAKKIIHSNSSIKFTFIGQAQSSPKKNMNMQDYLEKYILSESLKQCNFTGKLSKHEIIEYLKSTDLCIFPSIWENFPNVCLEAMSAGKAIIASKEGGMSDMITHLENGYLIKPNSPEEIMEAVNYFISNPEKVAEFGIKAREKVLKSYSPETILPQQIALYEKAIEIRQNKRKRLE